MAQQEQKDNTECELNVSLNKEGDFECSFKGHPATLVEGLAGLMLESEQFATLILVAAETYQGAKQQQEEEK